MNQLAFRCGGGSLAVTGALMLVASIAGAENLYYTPASTTTSTNNFGRYIYSSENWKTESGVYKYPADGDVLIYQNGGQLTAQGKSGYQATYLGGFVYDGRLMAVSQGEFKLRAGGVGMVMTNVSGTASWYCGVGMSGSGEVPIYVPNGATWSFQRYFWQRDNGEITLVKRGTGKIQFSDGSGYAGTERGKWKETRLEAGTFLWSIQGTQGSKYNYPQVFPTGNLLTFADQGSGATFSIDKCDLDLESVTLREDSPLAMPNHVFTSATSTNVYLRLVGTPGLNPMGFGGKLTERVGFLWNPDSDDNVFVFSNSVSTTTGGLRVRNGSVRLANGASFTQLSLLEVASGKTFAVETGAGGAFSAAKLVLDDATATVQAGRNVILSFNAVEVGGVSVADGVYTSGELDWFEGEGRVRIGSASLVDTDVYWERADGPTVLEANATTNYLGVRLSGTSLDFTAGEGALAFIGADGFTTAGDAATYAWGWPTVLDGARHTFDVKAGDTIEFTEDLALTGGTALYLDGGGTIQFTGTKNFVGNMEVTNGTIVTVGDDALGAAGGTTTFHLTSSTVKGKLDIRTEPGKSVVNIHRALDFHFWVTGEHGQFMFLPANATVNFYGQMRTTSSPLKPGLNPWPCHWNYSCPATTVVNWYGGMYAALNHSFPGGTHHIWKALTGGDRFTVNAGAHVYLHVTGNRVGAATGGMAGNVHCLAPYALDGRSANQLITMNATTSFIDMGGCDQALTVIHCNNSSYNGAKISSDAPALFHVVGNQGVVNSDPSINITNFVQFTGQAGLSMERTANTCPLVLRNTSSSTGIVQVTGGILKFAAPNAQGQWSGRWPNASAAVVKGGRLVLEHPDAFGTNTVMRIGGSGVVELPAGVRVKLPALEIGDVPQRSGVYGSTASGAGHRDDVHFAGTGVLIVGNQSLAIVLR